MILMILKPQALHAKEQIIMTVVTCYCKEN